MYSFYSIEGHDLTFFFTLHPSKSLCSSQWLPEASVLCLPILGRLLDQESEPAVLQTESSPDRGSGPLPSDSHMTCTLAGSGLCWPQLPSTLRSWLLWVGSFVLALALWTGNWSWSTFISPENGGLLNSCTHLTPVHEIFGFFILNFITFHHDTYQGLPFHIIRVVALGCHLGSPVVLVCPGLRGFLGQWPFQCWNCESPGQIRMSWSLLSSQAPVGFIATVLVDFWG